jgi:predicted transcriptional regulator
MTDKSLALEVLLPSKVLPSKKAITEEVAVVKGNLLDTQTAPDLYVKLYWLKEYISQLMDCMKEEVISQSRDKETMIMGAKLEIKNKQKKVDYGNDVHLAALEQEMEHIKAAISAWKQARISLQLLDEATGELLPLAKVEEAGVTPSVTLPK